MTNNKKLDGLARKFADSEILAAERCCPQCHEFALRCFRDKDTYGTRSYIIGYLAAQKEAEGLVEALKFYAPENNYDYDKVKDQNYIWNDQGKCARQTLETYNKGRE